MMIVHLFSYITTKSVAFAKGKTLQPNSKGGSRWKICEEYMFLELETRNKLDELCRHFDMVWEDSPSGIVVDNRIERFVLKFAKGKRFTKLYHENFDRNGKRMRMQYHYDELDSETLQRYYHVQYFPGNELEQVIAYIYYHGVHRNIMDQKRNIILQRILS